MGIFVLAALVALAAIRGASLATPGVTQQLEVFQAAAGFLRTISNLVDAFQSLVRWFGNGHTGRSPIRGATAPSGAPGGSGSGQPAFRTSGNIHRPVQAIDIEDEILEPAAIMGGGAN